MTNLANTNETIQEVAPGVFQLKIPMPGNRLGFTLPYVVTGPDSRFMIDTGLQSKEGVDAINDQLVGQLGIQPNSIDLILLTHNHPDHTGLVQEVRKLTGARTAMHRIDWESNPFRNRSSQASEGSPNGLGNPGDPNHADQTNTDDYSDRDRRAEGMAVMRDWYIRHGVPAEEMEGDMMRRRPGRDEPDDASESAHGSNDGHAESHPHGTRSGSSAHRGGAQGERHDGERSGGWNPHGSNFEPDVLLEGGETFSTGNATLQAVWTPGHTPGHVCFFDRENRMIFTGDHILPVITSNVSTRMATEDDPLGDYLDSIDKLRELDVALVLPAHQHHFTDLGKRLGELDAHHDKRLGAVLAACAGPGSTGYEVASKVPWDVGTWNEMDQFLRRAALGETLSHLEYLRRRGRVRRFRDDPHARWTTQPTN
jgi:glyoxylase-like metal-dependent hydrolase (beta-lactamase superfamily II)